MRGTTAVEVGRFAAGPSCAAVLADWGAQVIKVEPLTGDPARGAGEVGTANPRFSLHNRSRRSIAVDLTSEAGKDAVHRLVGRSDVFVTNLRPVALTRLGIDVATLTGLNDRLVYAQITGWGVDSELANDRSYDHGAFWSYAGLADAFADPGGVPAQPTGGMGDRSAGAMLAGAVAAALLRRERTGRGGHVSTSLLATGAWMIGSELSDALTAPQVRRPRDRRHTAYPTINCFRAADGRWLWLQMMFPHHHWSALLDALDAAWLDDDPRFRGGQRSLLASSSAEVVDALDERFAAQPLAVWAQRLRERGIPFSPVLSVHDLPADHAAEASGLFIDLEDATGVGTRAVASPCRYHGTEIAQASPAPLAGAHTYDILRELGYSQSDIDKFAARGAVRSAETG